MKFRLLVTCALYFRGKSAEVNNFICTAFHNNLFIIHSTLAASSSPVPQALFAL